MVTHHTRGFTLIELVTVIVLMSIVSMAGVEMIRYSASAYERLLGRQGSGNSARIAVDKISREMRQALPGSARVSGSCVEFIPIIAAGNYLDLPVANSAASFKAVPLINGQGGVSGRIAVYPVGDNAYDLSTGVLSASATIGTPDINNVVTVTMNASHQFPSHSPNARFFVVDSPVSFCVAGDNLFRYQNYGFEIIQFESASLPAGLPDRALLVNGVSASLSPFAVVAASLQRNAIVAMDLVFTDNKGEVVRMVHEVQLRNVP